jgi:hypothetical protein
MHLNHACVCTLAEADNCVLIVACRQDVTQRCGPWADCTFRIMTLVLVLGNQTRFLFVISIIVLSFCFFSDGSFHRPSIDFFLLPLQCFFSHLLCTVPSSFYFFSSAFTHRPIIVYSLSSAHRHFCLSYQLSLIFIHLLIFLTSCD